MRASLLAFVTIMGASAAIAIWSGCGSDEPTDTSATGGDGGAGSSSGGSSGGSSGAASSSGATGGDGGIDPPDAGPGGDTTKITCGTTTCAIPAQACCVSELQAGGDRGYACASIGPDAGCPEPPGGGDVASLKCSGSANCPSGQVCCVGSSNGGASSECKATCGNDEAQLCDPSKPDAGGCPANDPCSNDKIDDWGKLPDTYGTCGGQGN